MKKFMQKRLKNEKGMTLIELLAVIVILAIIAAIAIPAIGNIIDNSRVGAIKSDASNALQGAGLLLIDEPDTFDGGATINKDKLVSGYLDDAGSFEDTDFTISKATNGKLVFTGEGSIGSVKVEFVKADKATINNLTNNSEVGDANEDEEAEGVATVIAR